MFRASTCSLPRPTRLRPDPRALGALVALALAAPGALAVEVHHVPGDFGALQDAVDSAAPGDTIVVDGGDHL